MLSPWLDVLTAISQKETFCCCIVYCCITSSLYLHVLFLHWTFICSSCAVHFIVFLMENHIVQVHSYYCKASYSNNGNRVTSLHLTDWRGAVVCVIFVLSDVPVFFVLHLAMVCVFDVPLSCFGNGMAPSTIHT